MEVHEADGYSYKAMENATLCGYSKTDMVILIQQMILLVLALDLDNGKLYFYKNGTWQLICYPIST